MNSVPTRNKRSRDTKINNSFRRAVVFSPLSKSNDGGSQHRLATIIAKARAENLGIENVKQLSRITVQGALDEKRGEAQERIAATVVALQAAQSKAAAESLAVGTLRSNLKALQESGEATNKAIQELDIEIDRLKIENDRLTKMIEEYEEQTQTHGRKTAIRANRLQQQMSLFAGMTQIKWFFKAQELESDFLIGQVVGV